MEQIIKLVMLFEYHSNLNHITKNHITFISPANKKMYFTNLTGDNIQHTFHRNLMNIYLEQFETHQVHYDDIVGISTLENRDTIIDDLPNALQFIFICSSMCNTLVLSNSVKQTLRQLRIMRANMTTMPDIQGCIQLEVCSINSCNISQFNNTLLPSTLKEINLNGNNLSDEQSLCSPLNEWLIPTKKESIGDLIARGGKKTCNLNGNKLNYNKFPTNLANRIKLLRQHSYVFNMVRIENVAQMNIIENVAQMNIRNVTASSDGNNILHSSQTVHLSSVNASVVASLDIIQQYIQTHSLKVVDATDRLFKEFSTLHLFSQFFKTQFLIKSVQSVTGLTYEKTFMIIWTALCHAIQTNLISKEDAFQRMAIEITDSIDVCFTGKYNRIFNALVGVIDGVHIGISSQEEIQMEMTRLIQKYNESIETITTPDNKFEVFSELFRTTICDAYTALQGTPNAVHWIEAILDLAPDNIKIKVGDTEYEQSWDDFIITLREKQIIGVYQYNTDTIEWLH